MKTNFLRANQGEFMGKELNKTIMAQSRLHNKYYLKQKSANSKIVLDKQTNYCVNFLRRTKNNRDC